MDLAAEFDVELTALKARNQHVNWYPYHTLSSLERIAVLLDNLGLSFSQLAGDHPILDIGCGDGDLSFLLEKAGYQVCAIDRTATNHNGMTGVRWLRDALHSSVQVLEADVTQPGSLAIQPGGLALFLGVLYHVKSPVQALEALSAQADFCLMSTRISRFAPSGQQLEPAPVAYLLDEDELNNDNSNYWIFTPTGLNRLIRRSGWSVLNSVSYGDASRSDPVSLFDRDERVYCLLRNARTLTNAELAYGWTAPEGNTWRWTLQSFGLLAHLPKSQNPLTLTLSIFLPEPLIAQLGDLTLSCTLGGVPAPARTFTQPGEWVYTAELPADLCHGDTMLMSFTLDKCYRPPEPDNRELGLIVHGVTIT
jgi:SAM-dependent methyltransferase